MVEITTSKNHDGPVVEGAPENQSALDKVTSALLLVLEILVLVVRAWITFFQSVYLTFVPPAEKSVAGEVVLVTGTGHGIGRELALKYAALGSVVVCVDINEKGNEETVKMIAGLGATKAHAYRCDVSDRDEVLSLAAKVQKEVGPVSVLINNAGIMPQHALLKHNPQEIRRIFDINIMAHFWLLEAFLPGMFERKHGHVVATSSMCGQMGLPNVAPYCASKFAVRGLMESLAIETYEQNPELMEKVHFTTVYPYMVSTGLVKKARIRFENWMRMLTAEEVAQEVVTAMRRNENEISVPSWMLYFNIWTRTLPLKVQMYMRNFFHTGLLPE